MTGQASWQADENSSFSDLKKKILYSVTYKCLVLYFMLDRPILFRKGDFHRVRCSRMIIKGGILGGACYFWGIPT